MADILLPYHTYHITIRNGSDGMANPEMAVYTFDGVYYGPDADADCRLSQHIVTVRAGDAIVAEVLIADFANGLTPDDHSYVLLDQTLMVRCGSCLFSLALPDLTLNWVVKVDFAACFSVYPYENDVITHGEVSICRVSQQGALIWEYSGADIFVHLDGDPVFEMQPDWIQLMDFVGNRYRIDYDGKTVDFHETIDHTLSSPKPWWKFW